MILVREMSAKSPYRAQWYSRYHLCLRTVLPGFLHRRQSEAGNLKEENKCDRNLLIIIS